MFLTQLLPGLRDLRTPLATGYLWLVFLYLAFYNVVPAQRDAHGVTADLYQLADLVGRPATLAATTFIAYIAGALTQFETDKQGAVFQWVARRLGRIPHTTWVSRLPGWSPSTEAMRTLELLVKAEYDAAGEVEPEFVEEVDGMAMNPADHEEAMWAYEEEVSNGQRNVLGELPQQAIRLQKANQMLYDEYQRLQAEGTFRLNITVPLVFIIGTLMSRASLWYCVALLLPAVLVYQGNFRVQRSKDVIIQAIQMREITPDFFVPLREEAQRRKNTQSRG